MSLRIEADLVTDATGRGGGATTATTATTTTTANGHLGNAHAVRSIQLDVPDLVWHDDVTEIGGWAEGDGEHDGEQEDDLYNNWTQTAEDTCLVEENDMFMYERGVSKADASDVQAEEPCFICLEPLTSAKATVVVRRCKHVFHDACLAPWMSGCRRTCPACRAQIY